MLPRNGEVFYIRERYLPFRLSQPEFRRYALLFTFLNVTAVPALP